MPSSMAAGVACAWARPCATRSAANAQHERAGRADMAVGFTDPAKGVTVCAAPMARPLQASD